MMHVKLNLPPPSDSLIDQIKEWANSVQFNHDNKRWLEEFHNGAITAPLHLLGVKDKNITEQMILEFQKFFPKHTITSTVCIMKSVDNIPSCLPPHIDRGRALGINYFVDLGGNQVETIFYNFRKSAKAHESSNIQFDKTGGVDTKTVFTQGWHAFAADQCHAVDNITNTRIFTTIRILTSDAETEVDYNLNRLIKDYPELIDLQE
jgi:hypothetical protein